MQRGFLASLQRCATGQLTSQNENPYVISDRSRLVAFSDDSPKVLTEPRELGTVDLLGATLARSGFRVCCRESLTSISRRA